MEKWTKYTRSDSQKILHKIDNTSSRLKDAQAIRGI